MNTISQVEASLQIFFEIEAIEIVLYVMMNAQNEIILWKLKNITLLTSQYVNE